MTFLSRLSQFSCPRVLSLLSCSGCLVLYALSRPVSAVLSRLSCPGCFALGVLPQYPVLGILSRLSCPGCPIPPVLSRLSCPGCPVLAVLSGLLVSAVLSRLSCPGFPVLAVLSGLLVPAVLSQRSCSGCPVPAVLSRLSCPSCSVLPPAGLSLLSFPAVWLPLSFPCHVLAIQPYNQMWTTGVNSGINFLKF
jgi:hypothetical protein